MFHLSAQVGGIQTKGLCDQCHIQFRIGIALFHIFQHLRQPLGGLLLCGKVDEIGENRTNSGFNFRYGQPVFRNCLIELKDAFIKWCIVLREQPLHRHQQQIKPRKQLHFKGMQWRDPMTEFQLNHFKQALLCLIVTSQLHIAQIFLLQPDGRGIVFSFLICQLKIMVAEYRHVKVHHIAVVLDPLDLPMRLCDTFDPGVRTADADKYIQTALAVDLVNQLQRPQVQIVNEIPCGQWTLHGSLHLQ